ncbi:hypothetical protein Tco_1163675 [Tanacetum coccineum]
MAACPSTNGKIAIGTIWVSEDKEMPELGHFIAIVATSSTEAEYVAAANCCGQVLKIHTVENVADLLTKAFDGPRFNHLVVHIGMLNP